MVQIWLEGGSLRDVRRIALASAERLWLGVAPGAWLSMSYDADILSGAGKRSRGVGIVVRTAPRTGLPPRSAEDVRVAVCCMDRVQSVLGFLASGDASSALDASESIAKSAEQALASKVGNPFFAAAGAYVILRLRDLDRLHGWAENLMHLFPGVPDGAIIAGWKSLLVDRNVNEARDRFRTASSRGLPLYAEGVRLLQDGLTMVRDDGPVSSLRRYLDPTCLFTMLCVPWSQAATVLASPWVPDELRAVANAGQLITLSVDPTPSSPNP